jgi:COP9 signalosome complex subunit 2
MLMESQINPFDSQETKPFANDPEIVVLVQLVNAYQFKDINLFEQILSQHRNSIMNDLFIREYIDDVVRNIRMQAIEKLVGPYTRIELSFIQNVIRD